MQKATTSMQTKKNCTLVSCQQLKQVDSQQDRAGARGFVFDSY